MYIFCVFVYPYIFNLKEKMKLQKKIKVDSQFPNGFGGKFCDFVFIGKKKKINVLPQYLQFFLN